jgi:hypothetical protein
LRQYFFSSLVSWGGFILSQVGKSVFHIKIIFASVFFVHSNNKIVISSASDDVSQMCGILEVSFIFLRNVAKEKEDKHYREDDNKGSRSY